MSFLPSFFAPFKSATSITAVLFFAAFSTQVAEGQILDPVKWKATAKATNVSGESEITLTATIEPGWHLYSQNVPPGGPEPTTFTFEKGDYALVGKVKEVSQVIEKLDPNFDLVVRYFAKKAVFIQRIKHAQASTRIAGTVNFMVCDDSRCLPPQDVSFEVLVPPFSKVISSSEADTAVGSGVVSTPKDSLSTSIDTSASANIGNDVLTDTAKSADNQTITPDQSDAEKALDQGLWSLFLLAFAAGFVALFTPCVYPMVPLTVSFFVKRSGSRAKGITNALIYGLSIMAIFILLGVLVSLVFGPTQLNELSTNIYVNLLFFAIFVVFAASFLGAFELTLPASFVNKIDAKGDKGGLTGIFFMAFTLVLVSFSCTVPVVGSLLTLASKGSFVGPIVGMAGFSLAWAIPFTLFAVFPSALKTLPKSGGWLNSVKVVLGILELALALKFLSNVDLAYNWGILGRDVFLSLWIALFASLSLYLLGIIRFNHDSPTTSLSVPQYMMAMLSLAFTIYLIPGLFGAPLSVVAGYIPPASSQEYLLTSGGGGGHSSLPSNVEPLPPDRKYADRLHVPAGFQAFFTLDEAMAYAKKVNKPIFVDFTGHACTNCRKMEENVWVDPQVKKLLQEEYVMASLYCDDKTDLPKNEQTTVMYNGREKKIETLGSKNLMLSIMQYNSNAQPFYVLLDPRNGKTLAKPKAYTPDVEEYVAYLKAGIDGFSAASIK